MICRDPVRAGRDCAFTFGVVLSVVIGGPLARAQPAVTPQQERATAGIHEYFRRTTARLAQDALADVRTLDDWQRMRPVLREQLLDMLGLRPTPPRAELNAQVTGVVEHDEFVVEKVHFQSRPGLYVTGNFYRPKQVADPVPTILYLCGHGAVKIDGVSYGNKATYQHHAAWFAREGYCALVIDSLQLGEIEGLHHGTHREGMWWWASRGYTPAGVEAWNCVRALDYLETRPEVDSKRIGVTGRSGGGIYTWWLAAIDDRPACLVPVAGITDLENYVVDGTIEGHCDCMFMVNTYQWDFSMVAALAAPRPLLFSNTDKDTIFPLDGVERTHAAVKRIYDLHKAPDKLGLVITEGPHKDTQELQVPAFRWMNRWLQAKDAPIARVADKPLDVKRLRVFGDLPADQRNTTAHEWFVPRAEPPAPPQGRAEWDRLREKWLTELRERSFRGWPKDPPPLDAACVAEREADGLRLRVVDFTSDENLRLPLYVLSGSKHTRPSLLVVTVVDDDGWKTWLAQAGAAFGDIVPGSDSVTLDRTALQSTRRMLDKFDWALATLPPRGVGPLQWNPDKKKDAHIRRRFILLGRTADDGRVWDVTRAAAALRSDESLKTARLWLQGRGPSAGIALYAGLFTPNVERIDMHRPPATHRDGPHFLNVERTLDLPQAAALAFPTRLVLYDADRAAWQWTEKTARLFDKPPLEFSSTAGE